MDFRRFFRTFLWRLSFAYFWTSFVTFFAFSVFFRIYWTNFTDKTEQIVHWEVAEEYVRELSPFLSPTINSEELEKRIYQYALLVPDQEVYILNREGVVLFPRSTNEFDTHLELSVKPIEEFLSQRTLPSNPIYNISPGYTPFDRMIFSAARISLGSGEGYLLVVLDSRKRGATRNMVGDLTAFSAVVVFSIIGLILALLLGIAVFFLLTRRFGQMTAILREYREGDFSKRLEIVKRDELGEHAETINQMADQIVSSMEAIKARDVARRELISGVAHDLRTPVAVLQIALETLMAESKTISPEQLEGRIKQVLRSCESLDTLVQELFELSKLGAEDFVPNMVLVPVQDLVEGLHEQFSPAADSEGLTFTVSQTDSDWQILVDAHLIERALVNLLRNAFKFTRQGGTVSLEVTKVSSNLRIAIKDTGIGIPKSQLSQVFDRFFQAENAVRVKHQGTGLGLAIVKRIIELHNSKIQVASEEGVGTEFSFELPLSKF